MTEINYTPANRKRTMLTVLILSFITVGIYAQNTLNPDKQFSLWFGIRDYKQPPTETSAEPDFFDYYMDTDWESVTYRNIEGYLGMGYLRKWTQKFETDTRISINSGLRLNTFFQRAVYYPHKYWGVSLSYYACPQLMNDYSEFYVTNTGQKARTLTDQHPQWRIYDHIVCAGVVLPLHFDALHFRFSLHGGAILLSPFKTSVFIDNEYSNYRALHFFKFKPSASLFINPEASFNIDIHEFNGNAFGFQFQTSVLWAERSINYKRSSYEWTMDNKVENHIKGVSHSFQKFEFDAGLYFRW